MRLIVCNCHIFIQCSLGTIDFTSDRVTSSSYGLFAWHIVTQKALTIGIKMVRSVRFPSAGLLLSSAAASVFFLFLVASLGPEVAEPELSRVALGRLRPQAKAQLLVQGLVEPGSKDGSKRKKTFFIELRHESIGRIRCPNPQPKRIQKRIPTIHSHLLLDSKCREKNIFFKCLHLHK